MARRTAWVPVLGIAVLVILTLQVVRHDGIVSVDLHLRSWVAAHQIQALSNAITVLTDIVSPPVEIVVVLIYFWRRQRPRLRLAAGTILARRRP